MLLVIDTALAALSLALLDDDRVVASHHAVIGRGHAEALMTEVAALMTRSGVDRPDEIAVDIGPGSFTGLRIGIAAARALGLAWDIPVRGYSSLALVAAPHFAADKGLQHLAVVAEAGRGQVFAQVIGRDLDGVTDARAMMPGEAAQWFDPALPVAGPGAAQLAKLGRVMLSDDWPDARQASLLPPAVRAMPPVPIYVRPPDAVPLPTAA
ncbi:tRNA (adenosine(37)-N6)-threonylcarbamoyltransferase complex dimerization subunit type 1 TsaB [Glacieibacterium sp.]|uniref:tRNA (adenosine(37)-N6)-threonylcarbamoyltransferase complex dimerization subunit type 1 TsaB n=1 Tax=Glacieibacterium sp. TaxID=2860237 RepID=UPI003AFFC377